MLELRRQVFHAILGSAIAAFVYFFPGGTTLPVLIASALAVLIMRHAYARFPPLRWLVETFERKEDTASSRHFKGAFYLALGSAMAVGIAPNKEAALGILVLSVSDSLSTIVGTTFGKRKIHKNKTVEGTLAFFLSAFAILFPFSAIHIVFLTALTATLLELYSPIDDNLVLPSAVAFLLARL